MSAVFRLPYIRSWLLLVAFHLFMPHSISDFVLMITAEAKFEGMLGTLMLSSSRTGFCWFLLLADTWWCWLSMVLCCQGQSLRFCSGCPGPQGAGSCANHPHTLHAATCQAGCGFAASPCQWGLRGLSCLRAESGLPCQTPVVCNPQPGSSSLSLVPLVLLR